MKRFSLQAKFSLAYVSVLLVVLVFMNTYPIVQSEQMIFNSKRASLSDSVSVLTGALAGLETLTEENVASAMTLVEEMSVSRILVTDEYGRVLYDSRETDSAVGRCCLYTELVQALRGYDSSYIAYSQQAFHSRAASPVLYRNGIIGAVYAYEYDAEQAALLLSLQKNLLTLSCGAFFFALLMSTLIARALARRFELLSVAIRGIREGDYNRRAQIGGRDELTEIATEFNSLADRLQKTENARRRFVSDASHELKTPLAGIRLLSDSILQTEQMDGATVREFVGDIGQEAERLTRISENLLRLTRLDSDALVPAHPVAVAPVLERVLRMLTLIARERGVTTEQDVRVRAVVLADEDDLHQILYNLAENAIKYNRCGGFVRVTLDARDGQCVICVEDNGIGIPTDDLPRIFDRFYRVDKMRSRAAGGTGLGLSIVADTVRRRGGTIEADAREGGGSRFTVRLPLCAEGGEDDASE